jgi:hypothetical protein
MKLIKFTSSKVIFGSLAAAAFVAMGAASPALAYEKTGATTETKEPVKVTTVAKSTTYELFPAMGFDVQPEQCASWESTLNGLVDAWEEAVIEGDFDRADEIAEAEAGIINNAENAGCAVSGGIA